MRSGSGSFAVYRYSRIFFADGNGGLSCRMPTARQRPDPKVAGQLLCPFVFVRAIGGFKGLIRFYRQGFPGAGAIGRRPPGDFSPFQHPPPANLAVSTLRVLCSTL